MSLVLAANYNAQATENSVTTHTAAFCINLVDIQNYSINDIYVCRPEQPFGWHPR